MKNFIEYFKIREQEGVDSPFTITEPSRPKKEVPAKKNSNDTIDDKENIPLNLQVVRPKWKMPKQDILKLWQGLPQGLPIAITPIKSDHEGSTFSEDAIRITGSTEFIKSVLSRLKEFISYESEKTKLNISFRETSSPSLEQEGLAKTSYVFYLQIKERG